MPTITIDDLLQDIHNSIKRDVDSLNDIKSMGILEKIERAFRDTTSLEEGIKIGSGRQIKSPIDHSTDIKFMYDMMANYAHDKTSPEKTWELILERFKNKN